jgi:molybdopterin/thiamine biosynthesis adenylyltransferase
VELSLKDGFEQRAESARLQARISLGGAYDLRSLSGDGKPFIETWQIPIESRWASEIFIRVTSRFPFQIPEVFVDDSSLFGRIPHVNEAGKVCFCDESTSIFDPRNVGEVVLEVARRAIEVLNVDEATIEDDTFAVEFDSYWRAQSRFLSLLEDLTTARVVQLIRLNPAEAHRAQFLVADDEPFALRWLNQAGFRTLNRSGEALFLPRVLSARPHYPNTNAEMLEALRAQGHGEFRRWERYVAQERTFTVVISTVPSSRGDALFAWQHPRSFSRNAKGKLVRGVPGFRPGKEPIGLEMKGWGGALSLERFSGTRVDLARLQARTIGEAAGPSFKHLVVIGVGAIGSHLLLGLVESHQFERLTIVDPETLELENVLRHAAGFDQVGQYKADIMKGHASRKCPWIEIEAVKKDVLDCLDRFQDWCVNADLIVLAIGQEQIEQELLMSAFRVKGGRAALHRVWLTAEAKEGTVVRFILGRKGCPVCNLAPSPPKLSESIKYEPGCSAGFAEFGGSRLQRFVSQCVDAILRPVESGWQLKWTARPLDAPSDSDTTETLPLSQEEPCVHCGD